MANLTPSQFLPVIKYNKLPDLNEILVAIKKLRSIYTSTIAGLKIKNPIEGLDGWESMKFNESNEIVYGNGLKVEFEEEDDDDSFERKWSSNWLTRLISFSNLWIEEYVSNSDLICELEVVLDESSKALACVAGMTASGGSIDRHFKFHSLHPINIEINDESVNGHDDVGSITWGSSIHLSRLLCKYPKHFGLLKHSPLKVLELGSGTGVVGIVTARILEQHKQFSTVVFSDHLQIILNNLNKNVNNNLKGLEYVNHDIIKLDWNEPNSDSKFDLILGADICYDPMHAKLLHKTVSQLLNKPHDNYNPTFHILIAMRPTHTGEVEGIRHYFSNQFVQPDGWYLFVSNEDYLDVEKGTGRADELGYARFEIRWSKL